MLNVLNVGNKIEINQIKRDDSGNNVYVSEVLDIKGDLITAAMPISGGHIIPLEKGGKLETFFYTGKGIYKAECLMVDRAKEGNIYTMTLKAVSDVVKFQRRQYYRLESMFSVNIRSLQIDEVLEYTKTHKTPETFANEASAGMILDISGGGVRVGTNTKFERDSYIFLCFNLETSENKKKVQVLGKVIDCSKNELTADTYNLRVQYKEIATDVRDFIIKFIFEEQRRIQRHERGGE